VVGRGYRRQTVAFLYSAERHRRLSTFSCSIDGGWKLEAAA